MAQHKDDVTKRLDRMQSEIDELRARVVDVDLIVTDDDIEAVAEGKAALRLGKTRRL